MRQQRFKESYASLVKQREIPTEKEMFLALAPADVGVIGNRGRLGSRWAPRALLAQITKWSRSEKATELPWADVTNQADESSDFPKAQLAEAARLKKSWNSAAGLIHLGGGHDHVLSLLRAVGAERPLVVVNLDAHCDTRTDTHSHSGNPFRLFADESAKPMRLFQIGAHPYANSITTVSPLKRGEMKMLWRDECRDPQHLAAFLAHIEASCSADSLVVFSLDCDALKASDVGAVSAPNHDGLELNTVHQLVDWYRNMAIRRGQKTCFGVYEFNPLYDDVSGSSARVIAGILHRMLGA